MPIISSKTIKELTNLDELLGVTKKLKEADEAVAGTKYYKEDGVTTGTISRRTTLGDEQHDTLVKASREAAAEVRHNLDIAKKTVKSLKSTQDKNDFYTLYIASQRNKAWLDDHLDKLDVNDLVKDAYKKYHQDSDVAYMTANYADRRELEKLGYMYDDKNHIVRIDKDIKRMDNKIIKDADTGQYIDSIEELQAKLGDGYELRKILPREAEDLDYTHYLAKADSHVLKELPTYTLPYTEGGVRAYKEGTHYVKIGRTFYNSRTGAKYLGYAKTLKAGDDLGRLKKYADEVNKAVDIYNANKEDMVAMQRALNEAKFTEFRVTDATELRGMMRTQANPKGLLDPNPNITNARVFRSDEKFTYDMNKVGKNYKPLVDLDDYDAKMSEAAELRRQFYRGQGDDILDNINTNSFDHVVDPFEIWQRNITRAAQERVLGKMYYDWGEQFKQRYGEVIDKSNGYNPDNMTGQSVIATAKIITPNKYLAPLAREAMRSQASYKTMRNIPTAADDMLNNGLKTIFQAILPDSWWDSRAIDALRKSKPVEAANAIVFRTYLGLFNINQLYKNGILPIINTMLVEPIRGPLATIASPLVTLAHFRGNDGLVMKGVYKVAQTLLGMNKEEFNGLVTFIKKYGTFNQLSNRPELSPQAGKWLENGGDLDLIFLKTGTNAAQLIADITAYMKHGNNATKVAGYADDLLQNISRVNTSRLQQSFIGKLVMQFTSYPLSAMEVLANTSFTPLQRTQFALGQLYLFGLGGTFAKDYVTNIYNWLSEHEIGDPEWNRKVLDGVLTTAMAENGYDVRDGIDAAGMLNQIMSLTVIGAETFGSVPDLPVSSVPSILVENWNLMKQIIAPDTGIRDFFNWAAKAATTPHAPTSIRNAAQAYVSFKTKHFLDKNQDYIKDNIELQQTLMTLIGFKPIEKRQLQMNYETDKYQKAAIDYQYTTLIKPWVEQINNYYLTGKGKTEIPTEMVREEMHLRQGYKDAVTDVHAFVKRFCPEKKSYVTSLIKKDIADKKNKLDEFFMNADERAVNEFTKQFLGVE